MGTSQPARHRQVQAHPHTTHITTAPHHTTPQNTANPVFLGCFLLKNIWTAIFLIRLVLLRERGHSATLERGGAGGGSDVCVQQGCLSIHADKSNYGHVPVDMALKNPHVQAAWTCPHAGKHRESDSPVLPALRHQKHHTTESESAIRAHKAVSATNARFLNSVVTYGNEHMSTKPRREKQRNPCPQQRIRIPTRACRQQHINARRQGDRHHHDQP